ncbi:heme ABC exporter ATP-binding protein CcmA [Palleronia sp.]|uniref:heme ABC exporter ATP-binding protein CcmA n=1 Tax=Palleronia sp. TaxID=1940284 RepID=UPI0035C86716
MTLIARDLTVGRGGLPVLAHMSFTVEPGRALILRGPNGSGKTTLLRTLAGLQAAYDGAVEPGPDAVAYGGHRDGMKGQMTVAENLTFWAGLHGVHDIEPALKAFDLARLEDRWAQHLSAGQGRRLGLARLLVTGRLIWCLDEPTVSLDAENTKRFADMVRGHLAGGGIAVIATHIDLGLKGEVLDVRLYRATLEALE